jgi:hypothetical protein
MNEAGNRIVFYLTTKKLQRAMRIYDERKVAANVAKKNVYNAPHSFLSVWRTFSSYESRIEHGSPAGAGFFAVRFGKKRLRDYRDTHLKAYTPTKSLYCHTGTELDYPLIKSRS